MEIGTEIAGIAIKNNWVFICSPYKGDIEKKEMNDSDIISNENKMMDEINTVENCIKEEIIAKNSRIITINDVVFLNEECNITGINKKVEEKKEEKKEKKKKKEKREEKKNRKEKRKEKKMKREEKKKEKEEANKKEMKKIKEIIYTWKTILFNGDRFNQICNDEKETEEKMNEFYIDDDIIHNKEIQMMKLVKRRRQKAWKKEKPKRIKRKREGAKIKRKEHEWKLLRLKKERNSDKNWKSTAWLEGWKKRRYYINLKHTQFNSKIKQQPIVNEKTENQTVKASSFNKNIQSLQIEEIVTKRPDVQFMNYSFNSMEITIQTSSYCTDFIKNNDLTITVYDVNQRIGVYKADNEKSPNCVVVYEDEQYDMYIQENLSKSKLEDSILQVIIF